jgi:hypothetical protein
MPRTTIDIDAEVLRELQRRRRAEGRSLGQLASELLATALRDDAKESEPKPLVTWVSQPMSARVDLEDKEAVRRALDGA